MAQPADEPKEVSDFKFRSLRKIHIFDEREADSGASNYPTQKLAVANSLGVVFVGKIGENLNSCFRFLLD